LFVLDYYMFMTVSIDAELDELAEKILSLLAEESGELTTTEIRDSVGLETDDSGSSKVYYRVSKYLEPEGLVESHLPDPEPGKYPAKRISLTDAGEEFVAENDFSEPDTQIADDRLTALEDRIDALEAENERLREQVAESDADGGETDGETVDGEMMRELEQRVASLEETLEAQSDRIGDVGDEIAAVNSRIDSANNDIVALKNYPLIKSPNSIQGINRSLALSSALRELLMGHTEITDDMVRDEFNNRMAILDNADELVPTPD
jgi:DNA-binding PadR family transcriptional regulator